jgi:hypothetical protein
VSLENLPVYNSTRINKKGKLRIFCNCVPCGSASLFGLGVSFTLGNLYCLKSTTYVSAQRSTLLFSYTSLNKYITKMFKVIIIVSFVF